MTQKHLFVLDPLDNLNLKLDSSLRMAHSLSEVGSEVFFTTIDKLAWLSRNKGAHAECTQITFGANPLALQKGFSNKMSLLEFDGIHMRKDPPFDMQYITATWILDSVADRVKILNNPAALRSINEKLSIYLFEQYSDKALVSSNSEEIFQFIVDQCHADAILKPLHLFGGKGIERIKINKFTSPKAALSHIEQICSEGPKIVQPFNEKIYAGEVRAFAVGGEPLAFCLKKPSVGSYMANTGSGATLHHYSPPKLTSDMISNISERLLNMGVFLAGFDIIDNYISEINITSPRLLLPDSIDPTSYYLRFAKTVVDYCQK